LVVATLLLVALGAADANPFWHQEPMSMSEAAALRDAGEVARQIAAGYDPSSRYPVRAGLISSEPVSVTPMQAAIAAQREEIVQILIDAGATE
jgi:hypothetical protein